MKRMADARDSEQSDSSSANAPDLKRMRRVASSRQDIGLAPVTIKTLADEKETDSHRLAQRQKQIDYGKNTIGYDRYCAQVLKRQRRRGTHPMTPDKTMRISKKRFDGIVRKWRQALHKYDPPELAQAAANARLVDNASAINAMTTTVVDGAMNAKSEEEARAIAKLEKKSSRLLESKMTTTVPSRSIYENFDEDNFDQVDSNDDLL